MKDEFKRVIQSILSAEDEPMNCELHRSTIPACVEAELDGRDVKRLYPELTEHLETCPDCAEEYEELRRLLHLERQDMLEEPPRPGRFDLSFLRELPPKPQLWQRTEGNVRRFAAEITAQLGAKFVTLPSLPEMLIPYRRPAPAPVALRVKAIREPGIEELAEVLELPDPEANIRIRLLMGPVQAGRGTIMIQVEQLKPLRPLPRVRVTLRDQEMRLMESAPTAPDGTVTFRELAVGRYVIEVRHDGLRWELEFNLLKSRE